MLPSRTPEASKCLSPSPSTHEITHTHLLLVEVFYCVLFGGGPEWEPGQLRPSGGLCLGLGTAVPTEAESSRVLRGEKRLGTERPSSFLHSILQMKRGQQEGGSKAVPARSDTNNGGRVPVGTSVLPPTICPDHP